MKLSAFWRISLLYSIIAAVSCFAFIVILYLVGLDPFGNLKNLSWAIYGAAFALAMRAYAQRLQTPFQWYHGISMGFVINLVTPSLFFLMLSSGLHYTPLSDAVYDKYLPSRIGIAKQQVADIIQVRPKVSDKQMEEYQKDSLGYQTNLQAMTKILQEKNMDYTIMAVDHSYLIKGLFPLGIVLTFVFTLFSAYTLKK
jgi:hypothetical protein